MVLGTPLGKYALGELTRVTRVAMAAPRTICLVGKRAMDPDVFGRRARDPDLIGAQFDRDTETCKDWPKAA